MADSPYTGKPRSTEGGGTGNPGRLANPPSKGGIMNMTTPSDGGGKPPTCDSPYAASPRQTEGG